MTHNQEIDMKNTKQRIEPGPGQESVWDYPRPPKLEQTRDHLKVIFSGQVLAESTSPLRVLETSHPPVYYIPMEDVNQTLLKPVQGNTMCEFKGIARYFDVVSSGKIASRAAWTYQNPVASFKAIENTLAVYPSKMDACYVNDEKVMPQKGDFYGGWITSRVVGPFKGGPGTIGW